LNDAAGRQITLAVDLGASLTKVALMAPVDGRYRLLCDEAAPAENKLQDLGGTSGLKLLMNRVEEMTGWRIADESGRIVDPEAVRLVATASSPIPLRTLVVGPDEETARRNSQGLARLGYVEIMGLAWIGGVEKGEPESAAVERLMHKVDGLAVDVIAASVRTKSDAVMLGSLLGIARLTSMRGPVHVLFSGPDDISFAFKENLPDSLDFRQVSHVPWFQSGFDPLEVRSFIAGLEMDAGRDVVRNLGLSPAWTSDNFASPADNTALIAGLMAQSRNATVCVGDVGGRWTSVFVVGPRSGSRSTTSELPLISSRFAETDQGVGPGLESVLSQTPSGSVTRWIPFDVSEDELGDFLGNRHLRPGPAGDLRQLLVEQAVIRECLTAAGATQKDLAAELIVATGAVGRQPRLGQVALLVLDAFQPVLPSLLLADLSGILPRLGALARVDADAAVSVLQTDALALLGPCLSLTGQAPSGDTVARIEVEFLDESPQKSGTETKTYEIRYGTLTMIPLRPGQRGTFRISTNRKCSFGLDKSSLFPSVPAGKGTEGVSTHAISGGLLGVIVDARGRPLALSPDVPTRQARMMEWLQAVDAVDAEMFSRLG
jgi:hypothetical protein